LLRVAIQVTGANRNNSQQALALVDAIPACMESGDIHGIILTACCATAVTTQSQCGEVCASATLALFLTKRNTNTVAGGARNALTCLSLAHNMVAHKVSCFH
jgi:hypothetical protein